MGDPTNGPTWVYQAYCKHDRLLYVGIAYHVQTRISQHRATKPWWPEVEYVVAGRYETREEARAVEARIIRLDRPPHNVAGKPDLSFGPLERVWAIHDPRGHVTDLRSPGYVLDAKRGA